MLNNPLVVITRPETTADKLVNLCKNHQIDYIHLPVISLKPVANLPNINLSLKKTSIIFFVSPSAIKIVAEHINFNEITAKLLVVGKSSANVLAQYTSKKIYYPNLIEDSKEILKLSIWNCDKKHLTIIKGDRGRDILKNQLKLKGWRVSEIVVYNQKYNTIKQELLDTIDLYKRKTIIIVTSITIVKLLFNNIPKTYFNYFKSLHYICIHKRISDSLVAYGVKNIIITRLDNQLILKIIKNIGDHIYEQ